MYEPKARWQTIVVKDPNKTVFSDKDFAVATMMEAARSKKMNMFIRKSFYGHGSVEYLIITENDLPKTTNGLPDLTCVTSTYYAGWFNYFNNEFKIY